MSLSQALNQFAQNLGRYQQSEYADVSYIQNWSITGDIAILLKTVGAVFNGTGM